MNRIERTLVGLAILETPLQVDTYLLYQEHEASFGAVGGISVSLTTFCLIGLYLLWLLDVATRRVRPPLRLVGSLPLLLYVSVVAVSVLVAKNDLLAISYFSLLMQCFLLFLYIANRARHKSDIVFLCVMLACSLGLQSIIILGSWFVSPSLLEAPYTLGPLKVSVWEGGRLCGTLSTPVSAASYLAIILMPVGSMLLMPIDRRLKLLAILSVGVAALAIPLTQSRGSVAAVAFATVVFGMALYMRGWLPKWSIAFALLLVATAASPLWHVFEKRIVSNDQASAAARIHLSQIAWNVIRDQPLLGVGAGNYFSASVPYQNSSPFRSEWSYTVHCTYLLEWAEVGLLGLLAFLAFLISIAGQGWYVWRLRDPLMSPLALAISATVLGQMLHMFVDLFNSRPYIQTLWCCAAMAVAMVRLGRTQEDRALQHESIEHGNLRSLAASNG